MFTTVKYIVNPQMTPNSLILVSEIMQVWLQQMNELSSMIVKET